MKHINEIFSDIPILKTERLILRRMTRRDIEGVYCYARDPEVTRFLLWESHKSPSQTRAYLSYLERKYRRGEFFDWGIELDGRIVGTCGFSAIYTDDNRAELGYVLSREHWGRGIAAEAAKAVIKFGFERLQLNRIESRYMIGNEKSLSVMKKCGMTFEGIMRQGVYAKGEYRDVGIASILRSEYKEI